MSTAGPLGLHCNIIQEDFRHQMTEILSTQSNVDCNVAPTSLYLLYKIVGITDSA